MNMEKVIFEKCQLATGKPLVLGLSGGADSLCLYSLLKNLRFKLIVAHLDHQLRPGSADDAIFVKRIAERDGYPFILGEKDVSNLAAANKMTFEEAGRQARYDFLFSTARQFGAQAVAAAHSADDQVETVLMNFLRGSGSKGLSGMQYIQTYPEWDPGIPLVRPLLGVWRQEILEYCNQMKLFPLQDESNFDTTYFRNRVRHELLPYLQKYNPQVRKAIWRMAKNLKGDARIVQECVDVHWDEICLKADTDGIELDLKSFSRADLPIQRYVLQRALNQTAVGRTEIGFDHIQQCLEFLQKTDQNSALSVVGGIILYREHERLVISRKERLNRFAEFPQLLGEILIHSPGEWQLNTNWTLTVEIMKNAQQMEDLDLCNPFKAYLDLEKVAFPLTLRVRQPGDRFKPYGMQGRSIKVSDFFINEKLPAKARAAYPMLWTESEIAWLPGFRIGHGFEVSSATRRLLYLQLIERSE